MPKAEYFLARVRAPTLPQSPNRENRLLAPKFRTITTSEHLTQSIPPLASTASQDGEYARRTRILTICGLLRGFQAISVVLGPGQALGDCRKNFADCPHEIELTTSFTVYRFGTQLQRLRRPSRPAPAVPTSESRSRTPVRRPRPSMAGSLLGRRSFWRMSLRRRRPSL